MGNRVGFVGWLDGWLDGKEIFEYTPDRSGSNTRAPRVKPRSARNKQILAEM